MSYVYINFKDLGQTVLYILDFKLITLIYNHIA